MEKPKKISQNRKIADTIAEKYHGKVTGAIKGNVGRAGYMVEIEGCILYVFLIRTWHNNKRGISMAKEVLQKAMDDHALILMSYLGREFVIHSVNWDMWAREDNNFAVHPHYGTTEVFAKRDNFRMLDLDAHKIVDYYPVVL
jgi:hypothetical protein